MGTLLVTSLYEGDGKTAFCAGLARLLRRRGDRPVVVKAVTRAGSGQTDPDSAFYGRLVDHRKDASLPVAVSEESFRQGISSEIRRQVASAISEVGAEGSPVVVEAPALHSDWRPVPAVRELADELDARVVLIVRHTPVLGTSTIANAAEAFGARLTGIAINGVPRYRRHATETGLGGSLAEVGLPVLGVFVEERRLLGVTVADIAAHLGGEFLVNEEQKDRLVDTFTIGGLVLDWGVHYFSQSETQAVIVRGDRPDVQMAALHSPTRCLVLTGGHLPLQYVAHEAREEEIPIILVRPGTLQTAKALGTIADNVTVHHPEKADRFAEVLAQGLDQEAVAAALQ